MIVHERSRAAFGRQSYASLLALAASLAAAGTAHAQSTVQAPGPDADIAAKADPTSAARQAGGGAAPATTDDVVITGTRASLASARNIKRNASQIVDSIVADDIGKLPDTNVAESLQRITGVQIGRSQGEGSTVAIRGLPQVRIEVNGRSFFSNVGYYSNLEDIPSNILAGIDVYKSQSADLTEGGLGGIINIRTRRPFDFDRFTISATVKNSIFSIQDKSKPEGSLLISDRWSTSIGDIGVLFAVSDQKTAWASNYQTVQPGTTYNNLVNADGDAQFSFDPASADAGDAVVAPTGFTDTITGGTRHRRSYDGTFQWRPAGNLEFYVDGTYTDFTLTNDAHALIGGLQSAQPLTPSTTQPFTLFPGTRDLQSGTFVNVPVEAYSYTGDDFRKNWQIAGGGKWTSGRLSVSGELSYAHGANDATNNQLSFTTSAPTLTINSAGNQTAALGGVALDNPANYAFNYFYLITIGTRISEKAGRLDLKYQLDLPVLDSIDAGFRYSDVDRQDRGYFQGYYGSPIAGRSIATLPSSLWSSVTLPVLGTFVSPSTGAIRELGGLCGLLQGANGCAGVYTPDFAVSLRDKPKAAYGIARLKFALGPIDVDGDIGVRELWRSQTIAGFNTTGNGTFTPSLVSTDRNFTLPSANLRFRLDPLMAGLQLRLSASKSIGDVPLSKLSPSTTVNPNYLTGSGGNPNLRPFSAKNLDATVEYYFGRTGQLYASGFYKKVDGFLQTVTTTEQLYGATYQIFRPINGGKGTIKGAEVGAQAFFDFLPGALSGLGAQANYTYVDSKSPGPLIGQIVPLEGLSKNSYNLVALYEKYGVSARLAYNWRGSYVTTTSSNGAGNLPIVERSYGQLDASLAYDVNRHVRFTIDAVNLLNEKEHTYYGLFTRPYNYTQQSRRVLGVSVRVSN